MIYGRVTGEKAVIMLIKLARRRQQWREFPASLASCQLTSLEVIRPVTCPVTSPVTSAVVWFQMVYVTRIRAYIQYAW